jgi:hypothetical protein
MASDAPNSHPSNVAVLEQPLSDAQRQRHERNHREQLRGQRLRLQIEALRDLFMVIDIYCSPSKRAILSYVVQYIAQLQRRALVIDAEQQRLQATVRPMTELLQGGGMTHSDSNSLSTQIAERLSCNYSLPGEHFP